MPKPRVLIHSAWFDLACARLGESAAIDEMLGRELYRVSLYADLVPMVDAHAPLRIFRTAPFLREDGQIVRLWIYFALRSDDVVELQHIGSIEEDMSGAT